MTSLKSKQSNAKENLQERLKDNLLCLDGAMGTMIQNLNLTEETYKGKLFKEHPIALKGNNDVLNITQPDIINKIYEQYLLAGADLITTNTFNAQNLSQFDYKLDSFIEDINLEGCKIARKVADRFTLLTPEKPRYVLGSIGPSNKSASLSPDANQPAERAITWDEIVKTYSQQAQMLIKGKVDALLLETAYDSLNIKATIWGIEEAFRITGKKLPIMLSFTIMNGGRLLAGQSIEALVATVKHLPLLSLGMNCAFGAKQMAPYLRQLAAISPFPISFYPNAGLPNELGQYSQTPEEMTKEITPLLEEKLINILGGCCGTTDKFIRSLHEQIKNAKPRITTKTNEHLILSGQDTLTFSPEKPFILIGERCNVAGSRKFLRLIKEKKYEEAIYIAQKQVTEGAQILDINMDDGLIDAPKELSHFLRLIANEPEIARVPIMIDSSTWEVVESALKNIQGKPVVNSISLKEGEEAFLKKASYLQRYGASVVIMAFDEKGQADTYDRKIEICQRAYQLLVEKLNFPPNEIIFDPNVLAICTGLEAHRYYAYDFIRAVKWIRKHLPKAQISGGISNLSFAFRGNNYLREAMHAVFLYHAIQAGMNMGIVNPNTQIQYTDIPESLKKAIENIIFYPSEESEEKLLAIAQKLLEQKKSNKTKIITEKWREESIDKRLSYAIQHGNTSYLREDLEEALKVYQHPVDIIEGPLMKSMNMVGELFGAGKMFLPQVVKTSRTMKQAVEILQPYLLKGQESKINQKILLATVKGDVHDIGKNIVSVVLTCNGFKVIDLGVMVASETIIQKAKAFNVDVIGLSGLITPSLHEMTLVVKEAQKASLNIPIMVGGAATSALHTALKIAPEYENVVIHTKDASQAARKAIEITTEKSKNIQFTEIRKTQSKLREEYKKQQTKNKLTPLKESRENKPKLF